MPLRQVTITGADDSIEPNELVDLTKHFPFVEWGILLSSSQMGGNRFPSHKWLTELHRVYCKFPHMAVSFHVCGSWVRDICAGNWTPLFANIGKILDCAKRVQLNFHAYKHLLTENFVPAFLKQCKAQDWQMIFQCDGVNDYLVSSACRDGAGFNIVPLYDKSGGAGVVPSEWPVSMAGSLGSYPRIYSYSGYAGGLGSDNLAVEIPKIAEAAQGGAYWIDMETKVRSDHDHQFDLKAVYSCLEISSQFVDNSSK